MSGHPARRFPVIMTTAFVLAQFRGISCAEELGRLFTTPEERSLLENLRNPAPVETSQTPAADDPAPAEQEPGNRDIAVKGFVLRKNGLSTVWVNNSLIHAHETPDRRLRITTDASAMGDFLIDITNGTAAIRVPPEKISHPQLTE